MIIQKDTKNLDGIDFTEGHVVLINKELEWTSFDVVNKLRYMIRKAFGLKKIKVGHGGTLDPLATGVVVVGVGKETKNLQSYQDEVKEYIAEVAFGYTTASFDSETELEGNYETTHINKNVIQECMQANFSGEILQIPPVYSAKSVDGIRAYKAARSGKEIEMKPVLVTIYEHELLQYENNIAHIRIVCSKGTYIRSIANDLGKALQSGAYLHSLQRTKSGGFLLEQCMSITEFEKLIQKL